MLRSSKDIEHYTVSATDGDVGNIVDFLLDDERWIVRYLVVDAGNWLGGRQVLISPISFRQAEWSTRRFHLALTKAKIENAPNVDVDLPVARQHECSTYIHRPRSLGESGRDGCPLTRRFGRPPGGAPNLGTRRGRPIDRWVWWMAQAPAPAAKELIVKSSELDHSCADMIRFLSVDKVERAESGHPGLPMGAAPMAYVLWTRFLRPNPANPQAIERALTTRQS